MRQAGQRIGRYELLETLGAGGMGEVWRAVLHGPHGFRKAVALKLLLGPDAGREHRSALIREARLGALVAHPNVVDTYELGEVDGRWYVAMELVEGASVEALRMRGPLSPAALLDLARQACDGLAHLHGLCVPGCPTGLVHRDIKPSNLLVDVRGVVKIADLGVARLAGATGSAAGTRSFMAPEQASGREDARADLFALGVTLYLLTAGRLPFGRGAEAVALATQASLLLREPAFLAPVEEAVPGLGRLVGRCLHTEPQHRWPTATALGAALRRLHRETREARPADRSLAELVSALRPDAAPPALDTTGAPAQQRETVALLRGRVPASRGPLVGRNGLVASLRVRLNEGARVLTLLGPGGIGKTRLAHELARMAQEEREGGAWCCELAEARTPVELCAHLADALDLPLRLGDAVAQLGDALAARGRALVLLDGVERCAAHLPAMLARWLQDAPLVAFLITSRRVLRMDHEIVCEVGPLDLADAARLFARHAPRASATDDAVLAIAHRLEGIPLAIELAAARTRLLSAEAVRDRLDDRLALLRGGSTDRPARQRSLRASLDASWELLEPTHRAALAQLSAFRGGWDLRAAEAVVDLGDDARHAVLDALEALLDHSLVRFDPDEGRFTVLDTIRAYASGKLDDAAREAAEARHGAFFAQPGAPEALSALERHGGIERRRALARDLENLVAASERAAERGDPRTAAAAALGAWAVIQRRGPYVRIAPLVQRARAAGATGREAELLVAEGSSLLLQGETEAAERCFEASLDVGLRGPDPAAIAVAHLSLGRMRLQQGQLEEARALFDTGCAVAVRAGHRLLECRAHSGRGGVALWQGRLADARTHVEASLRIARELGDRGGEAEELAVLGAIHLRMDERERGLAALNEALAAHRASGARYAEALALCNLGAVLVEVGREDEAAAPLLAARELLGALGAARSGTAIVCDVNLGNATALQGNYGEARALLADAVARFEARGAEHYAAAARVSLACCAAGLGDWPAFDELAELASTGLRASGFVDPSVALLATLGRALCLAADFPDRADALPDPETGRPP